MPLRQATISSHAWERFVTRWEGPRPPCYRRELTVLMADAREQDIGYASVTRMLEHNFTPARYWAVGRWRFVTNEEVTLVLTVERPFYQKKQPMGKPFNAKRHGKSNGRRQVR